MEWTQRSETSNAGGGGERVLWTAIRDVQREFPHIICAVYTGDIDATKEQIIFKVKNSFNIDLNPQTLVFIYLHTRYLVEDSRYPRLTLLLQSLSSVVLGYEAMSRLVPDLYFGNISVLTVILRLIHCCCYAQIPWVMHLLIL
ncbi:hypothetical protein BJV82DRAFT_198325 [Fennellomyces sp. T-0311]|nr:hypothetical protein BJV82DRAFT_198325 [Fennellomyces sp. T-0311]